MYHIISEEIDLNAAHMPKTFVHMYDALQWFEKNIRKTESLGWDLVDNGIVTARKAYNGKRAYSILEI